MQTPEPIGLLKYFTRVVLTGFLVLSVLFTLKAQKQMNTALVGQWFSTRPDATQSLSRYNDCWGFVVNGEEFAVIGSTIGSHIIHIPINGAFQEVGFIPGGAQGNYVVHRDYAVYNNHLYTTCDQQPSGLQIVDISELPYKAELVRTSTEFFTTAHNITADACTGKLYVSGPSGNALTVLDASVTPDNPQLLSHFNLVEYVHDVYVRCDTAFLSAAHQGLYIMNFVDAENPIALGILETYPDQGYNHSGWLNEAGDIYVFADETPGKTLKVCDVSDFSNIQVIATFKSNGASHTTAHNVVVENGLVYVSYYFDGLQIFNIDEPSEPKLVGWYRTYEGDPVDFRGAWGVHKGLPSQRILISDRQSGLSAFRYIENHGLKPDDDLALFPNPGGSRPAVMVRNKTFRKLEHRVFDLNGRMVDQGTWSNQGDASWVPIALDNAAQGIYLIQITIDDGTPTVLRYVLGE